MQIGLRCSCLRVDLNPERMLIVKRDALAYVRFKYQDARAFITLAVDVNGDKWHILNNNSDLFDRRDQKISIALPLQNRGKQPHERWPPNRRALVKPGTIAPDAHVDLAAIGRIPQMHRRQAPPLRGAGRFAQEPVCLPAFFAMSALHISFIALFHGHFRPAL